LGGDDIPLGARIVHVVDAFDAMTTNRPYRDAMPRERAVTIIRQNAGTQFDPAVVDVFLLLVHSGTFAPPLAAPMTDDVALQLNTLQKGLEARHETSPVG
jgi:HD-GYP domain-containing protein (c-di-GMP phosphodiesterase class II)